jgi:outer membrane protein assembly factor BamB
MQVCRTTAIVWALAPLTGACFEEHAFVYDPDASGIGSGYESGSEDAGAPPGPPDSGTPSEAGEAIGMDAGPAADSQAGRGPLPDPATAPSYLMNPAHTGSTDDPGVAPPLARAWTAEVGQTVSYPLIAGGLAYVLVGWRPSGNSLLALDTKTGKTVWGPVNVGHGVGHTLDAGRVFTVTTEGQLAAWDAASGAPAWTVQLQGQYLFTAAPTAYRGIVYVSGAGNAGTVYAIDELDGTTLWTQPVQNGDISAPTVTEDGVFVSYGCVQAYAFGRNTGSSIWYHAGPCEGGGGATTVLFAGHLYAPDLAIGSLILDAATGGPVGTFSSGEAPAAHGSRLFYVNRGTLTAVDAQLAAVVWTFAGDGALATSPIVTGGRVYVGSSKGVLFGVDEATGTQRWSDAAGQPFVPIDDSTTLSALSAADGILLAPAVTGITAYVPGPDAGTVFDASVE